MWTGDITFGGNITQVGNYNTTGALSFNGVIFNTHVHGDSPGPSNP